MKFKLNSFSKMNSTANLNNGFEMPLIGVGTFKIQDPAVVDEVIRVALDTGYRSIDTAAVYKNEVAIGIALKKYALKNGFRREEIFITTKLGPDDHGTEACAMAFEKSLANLGLDYIDLYLIHWPGVQGRAQNDPAVPKLRRDSWLEMEKIYKTGKARAIGVSNYTVNHLKELLTYCTLKPAVLQVEYHPHLIQHELLEFCRDNSIHLQAYSSLGTSHSNNPLLNDKVVIQIAENLNKTPAQILLKWAIQQKIGVIPKSVTPKYIESNFDISGFFLSSNDMDRLKSLDKQHHYCWDPEKVI